jgi:hypothetical protein
LTRAKAGDADEKDCDQNAEEGEDGKRGFFHRQEDRPSRNKLAVRLQLAAQASNHSLDRLNLERGIRSPNYDFFCVEQEHFIGAISCNTQAYRL